uniref:Uncharacterized protein n=1 Tax=Arundo donax TaxID=35708 RepID=A0A0A9CIR7_ARUDO
MLLPFEITTGDTCSLSGPRSTLLAASKISSRFSFSFAITVIAEGKSQTTANSDLAIAGTG